MLLEEFFNYQGDDDETIAEHFYVATLTSWLINNELEIYDEVLSHFEEREEYVICHGIKKAIDKIESTIDIRFSEAASVSENESERVYEIEEYKRISRDIFKDILLEIYDRQIEYIKKDN